ncbi:hypothetical protein PCANC_04452 [Puccinia coronata f. sp. avenae]|uniref:Uncharacterized protein n=1 Tax=Puccinia coronata f. sp. avenae TaxID=200324 RepID=A0A2N5VUQ8_9BASI|nr:hypothetical protein PCASD_07652 [Puccinia coronata f. sp. avenae]PLW53735.1 hypothetical protein PCANC_04452 [Puccinia coronata f. sp. avenae]
MRDLDDQLAARGFNGVTTIETASQSYQYISTQIQSLRVNVAARRVDASTASWQLQSFSSQASLILQAINGCERCYNRNYVSSLTQYAQQLYAELNMLFEACYEVYGEQAINILAYLSQLDWWCQQNLYLFYQNGVYPQVILPARFLQNTYRIRWINTYSFAYRYNTRSKRL